jgi:hypothetical protein
MQGLPSVAVLEPFEPCKRFARGQRARLRGSSASYPWTLEETGAPDRPGPFAGLPWAGSPTDNGGMCEEAPRPYGWRSRVPEGEQ